MGGDNIRKQYLSKILPAKPLPLHKDVHTPTEFLLGNNLNDRMGKIEKSQKNAADLFQFPLLQKF